MLNKILSGADPADMRVSHIILVPDRCTLAAEKEALSLFGGSFSIQVLTMRRFASRILPEYRYIDKESAVLAVTGIAEKNRDKMKCFRGGRAYGFPDSVVEVIGQLKYSRISPEKMTCADLPGYLKNKVDDIRLIYTEYERFLSGGLKDSADRLTALMQAIPYSPLVADSHFYIKDFDNFSKQETEIISLLIKHSLSVTAAVAMCDFPSHSMIYLNEAFISLKNTVEKLESEGQLDPADVSFYFGSEMEERESFLFSYEEQPFGDILLLDIQMAQMNGMELARKIRERNRRIQIAFLTGLPDFISEGYEVDALHYLIKPIQEKKLFQVLDRAALNLQQAPKVVLLPINGRPVRIPTTDILYAEAFSHTILLHLSGGEESLRMRMSDLQELLGEDFYRCHRSYIVSLEHIRHLSRSAVFLDNGQQIPLARSAYDGIHQAFIHFH